MIRVEYFIILDKKEEYLKEEQHFDSILRMLDGVNVEKSLIKYNEVNIDYKVKIINIDDRIINCQFSIEETSNIDQFEKFLRVFRTIFIKIVGVESIETLWDDIGFYYAKLAYPIIHKIENEMRALITKFMYLNVGRNWTVKHIPEEVKNSIKEKSEKVNKKSEIANFLDKVDFIQLTNFLFEEYSNLDKNKILNFIKNNKNKEFTYKELEDYIPISNWDRFFKAKLSIESKELQNKWEELYKLRCKVAHNNKINKKDYERIKTLSENVEQIIKSAMDSLDNITIEDKDKVKILDKIHSINDQLTHIRNKVAHTQNAFDSLKNISLDTSAFDSLRNIVVHTDALNSLKNISLDTSVIESIRNIPVDTDAFNSLKNIISSIDTVNLSNYEESLNMRLLDNNSQTRLDKE